ncbi:25282_t:CDS:2, partial [Gigaspora margarita]
MEVRDEIELICNLEKVKKEIEIHFKKQFSRRNVNLSEMPEKRKMGECNGSDKNQLSPGASGIPYPLLKNCSTKTKEIFRKFATRCIET